MGSSSSKPDAAELALPTSSSSGVRRSRSKGSKVFQSSCLGSQSGSHESERDEQIKENGFHGPSANQNKSEAHQVKAECYSKVKAEQPDETACISSSNEYDEWGQSNLSDLDSRAGSSSSRAFSTRSLDPPSRSLSCFKFFPGNSSCRLSRATSLGSSRADPPSSTSFTVSNDEEQHHVHIDPARGSVNRNVFSRGRAFLPACLINRSPSRQLDDFASGSLESNPTSVFFDNLRDDQITSALNVVARDADNPRGEFNVNLFSLRNHTDIESMETTRLADRRIGAREPVERNVRFSRTLSVGRLRDRVLRRSAFPDLTFSALQQEREVRDASQPGGTQALGGGTGLLASNENALISSSPSIYASSGMPSSFYSSQDSEVETSRARDTRYHDLLEHRSNFLERRRRIRSQVHALQRLGSRFENLSGHERSCIISGQHRTGHCTCPIRTRDANSTDDTSARASISRIVMLAEALFEVLDEIHQQSVVLSSQPSVSPIGSVPAPIEVVESLPVKLYSKSQKHLNEEAAQCYICLVEYEEGDSVRILPCHHEFHRTCVDKWLKDVHRVCPLCRGDICRPDSVLSEN
ncbi:E3 ubiquitin-protein like [Actinidia chinensis var. chinensis]|uniref:E3 ubiquitin-protein like n=1 Tax=Actinidia chinensis var. chinensis TaxID=1590841 RepID=A0A2R6PHI6_ACTCC|nr:E3 ubiquitin-protein like [Actinidia chinensis var. chinensis]